MQQQREWISVDKRTPEHCKEVLVVCQNKVTLGYLRAPGWRVLSHSIDNGPVTHWMDKPELPQCNEKLDKELCK